MYKKNNMLREKRKHANYKPNRRLDAKSSRGMIYENEELRIRTININAEVERGQSEIKNLKREREQLRREIWTLRDEYDKLENLLRIKGIDPDEFRNELINNDQERNDDEEENSDGSDCCSCESCCSEGCSGGCCENDKSEQESSTCDESSNVKPSAPPCETGESSKKEEKVTEVKNSVEDHSKRGGGKDRLKLNFDHLSVVAEAEESSEANSLQGSLTNHSNEITTTPLVDLSAFLHNVDVLSPLSYLQKLSPPLSHFESLCENMSYDKIDDRKVSTIPPPPPPPIVGASLVIPVIKNVQPKLVTPPATPEEPSEPPRKESRIKHFFSPIRKKISQPDVLISTALPVPEIQPSSSTAFIQQNDIIDRSTATIEDNAVVSSTFQTGGNLEELLHDIEALSKGIAELQTNCTELPKENGLADVKKKPFRSELNLVLSYPSDLNPSCGDTPSSPIESTDLPSPIYTPLSVLTQPPLSPITPPINFKSTDLNFVPVNANVPIFSSNSSIFCTVSAPSTPAVERKFMERFHSTESNLAVDKKKQKRVSIINDAKDEKSSTTDSNSVVKKDGKESQSSTHHSHIHKNHSHSHSQPKRRMSLDNSTQKTKHKNHRQICPETKVNRRESNKSNASFKKRSDNASGDDQGGTSMSERYSASIASSRESSTSLSLKSGKRRISITSYGNSKKIPWCGCWGSGCL